MIFLFSIGIFLIGLLAWKKFHFILNPITVACFIWSIILPLSSSELYGVFVPSDKTYLVIIVGFSSFLIGAFVGSTRSRFVLSKDNLSVGYLQPKYRVNYTFVHIICLISIGYYLFQLVIVVRLLTSGMSYYSIRQIAVGSGENVLNSSTLIAQLKGVIAYPTTYMMIALLPVELFFGKKNKIIIFEAIVLMVMFVLTSGGRSVILWFAVYVIAIFFFYKKQHPDFAIKVGRKYKKYIIILLVLLFIFMLYITKSRKGDEVDLVRELYIYFVVPMTHFSHYIDVVDGSGVYGMGISSFYGFLYPLFYLLRLLRIFHGYPEFILNVHYMSFEMMERGYPVGGGINMNAFVTMFYQPYLDGRIIGVVMIMLIFGFVCSRAFVNAYYRNNIRALLVYILFLQKIIFSVVRFYFTQSTQAICIVFAILAIRAIYNHDDDYGILCGEDN